MSGWVAFLDKVDALHSKLGRALGEFDLIGQGKVCAEGGITASQRNVEVRVADVANRQGRQRELLIRWQIYDDGQRLVQERP